MIDEDHKPPEGELDRDFHEQLFGRGPGDPDFYGYPGVPVIKEGDIDATEEETTEPPF